MDKRKEVMEKLRTLYPTLYRALVFDYDCSLEIDGCPNECHQFDNKCRFAKYDSDPEAFNKADPGEGYYQCSLLNERVWGENPKCTKEQWEVFIIEDLAKMLGL